MCMSPPKWVCEGQRPEKAARAPPQSRIACKLADVLAPFVEGDLDGFERQTQALATELSTASFGATMLQSIGFMYINSAEQWLGDPINGARCAPAPCPAPARLALCCAAPARIPAPGGGLRQRLLWQTPAGGPCVSCVPRAERATRWGQFPLPHCKSHSVNCMVDFIHIHSIILRYCVLAQLLCFAAAPGRSRRGQRHRCSVRRHRRQVPPKAAAGHGAGQRAGRRLEGTPPPALRAAARPRPGSQGWHTAPRPARPAASWRLMTWRDADGADLGQWRLRDLLACGPA